MRLQTTGRLAALAVLLLPAAAGSLALAGCDAAGPSGGSDAAGPTAKGESARPLMASVHQAVATALSNGVTAGAFVDVESEIFQFCGEAGDVVTIRVRRLDADVDPVLILYSETGEVLAIRDDEVEDDFNGPYNDPLLQDFVLPSTGTFTLEVRNFLEEAGRFQIEATGLGSCVVVVDPVVDTDGDGIADGVDPFPTSDRTPTVVIGGQDSGVANQPLGTGATFSDLIGACATEGTTHGAFVSCVSGLTNEWVAGGRISGRDKGAIVQAAARSGIGQP